MVVDIVQLLSTILACISFLLITCVRVIKRKEILF